MLYLDFLDASYARIGRSTIAAGTATTFHDVTRTELAPSGTAFARVTIYGYVGNYDYTSTFDWDDIALTAN